MNPRALWFVVLAILAGAAIYLYIQFRQAAEPPPPPPPVQIEPQVEAPPPEPVPEPQPVVQPAPIPEPEPTVPLPALADSDPAVTDALAELVGTEAVAQILVPTEIIRRIVATVDNLPREKLAVRLWPIVPTPGRFMVSGWEGSVTLSPENAARYAPLVRLVAAVKTKKLAETYLYFYPLFQQEYSNLGYPDKEFNQRLMEVIDHLLATPEVKGTIELVQPVVYYKFADPALEAKSAGQKALIRIGPDNAAIIKSKLREFRQAVVGRPTQD